VLIDIDIEDLPPPADAERASIGRDRWRALSPEIKGIDSIADDPTGAAVLDAIFGNSPYLTGLLLREAPFALQLFENGPDRTFAATIAALEAELGAESSIERLMSGLRRGKSKIALLIAIADITGIWPLEAVTGSLSDYADLALKLSLRYLLRRLADDGVIALPDGDTPEVDAGLVVLALGKLGARELNYSSDIDIMVLYEPEKLQPRDPDTLSQELVRATRMMMRIMDERTADGYVFRTDLRLRPDPGATPLAIPVHAAEVYYESVGQNWERAAMIRARAAAGDIGLGKEFLHNLRPFIWRKFLDFAAIQDIHSIKRQITAYRGGGEIAVNGHNIKLGRGGIREVEFFAQTQQLIWGGRYPALRTKQLCETLAQLADHGRVEPDTADAMARAYRYLRRLEHRLQMVDDHQTHEIPKNDPQVDAIATFMGYPTVAAFRDELLTTLALVEKNYAELFEDAADLGGEGTLVFTGTENHPETVQTLETMGFRDGASISSVIRNWHHGRYRATRSVRSRELLTEFMPRLVKAFATRAEPDGAFARFDAFLAGLPAGVQLFSLFYTQPQLLDLVAEIMGDAPRLAEWLSRNPRLLDHVLAHEFYQPPGDADVMRRELSDALAEADDFQDALELSRRWTNDKKFQVGVQILRGMTDGHSTGPILSDIAETVLRGLWPHVLSEFAESGRHGDVPGGGIAAIALGKLGGGELMPESDLDLVFVYDVPDAIDQSDGERPLATSVYYMRLSQRIAGAIEALTGEGRLYEVDTRLRPSGNKGPAAARLDGYIQYFEESAWTWEHMALTRARVVAGSPELKERLEHIIHEILTKPRDADKLVIDVATMRARMAKEHRGQSRWDIKHRRGGLVDAEFIAQYLLLRHAAEHPGVLTHNATEAYERLETEGLLDPATAAALRDALQLWHNVQTVLRVTTSDSLDQKAVASGPRAALLRATDAPDFDTLVARMDEAAQRVHGYFIEIIDRPAEAARLRLPAAQDSGEPAAAPAAPATPGRRQTRSPRRRPR
jgi:glutamate-ammonia-ligase adenylyltransferase